MKKNKPQIKKEIKEKKVLTMDDKVDLIREIMDKECNCEHHHQDELQLLALVQFDIYQEMAMELSEWAVKEHDNNKKK